MGGTERFQENGIIQIENLVKRYGSFVALDHLNLNVREGKFSDFWDQTDRVKQR